MAPDRPPEGQPYEPIRYTSDVFPTERVDTGDPPVHTPVGNDAHYESRRQRAHSGHQRPWYHPRPQPRRRMDVMGFNMWMWLIAVVLVVVLLLWY
jgi:hypothetical protein